MGRMNLGSHILNSFGITAIDKRIKKDILYDAKPFVSKNGLTRGNR